MPVEACCMASMEDVDMSLLQTSAVTFHGMGPEGVAIADTAGTLSKTVTSVAMMGDNYEGWTLAGPWCRTIAALALISSAGVVAMIGLQFCIWCLSPTQTACKQMQMMALLLNLIFFTGGYLPTYISPTALPLARYLGHGEDFSALVMSAPQMLAIGGAFLAMFVQSTRMTQPWQYAFCLVSLALQGLFNLLSGLIAQGALQLPACDVCFIALRAVDGFFRTFCAQMLAAMCQNVVPTNLRVPLQIVFGLVLMLGSGSGPLAVFGVTSPSENTSAERFGVAAPFYMISAFMACLMVTTAWIAPTSSEDLQHIALESHWKDKFGGAFDVPQKINAESKQLWLRKVVFACGVLYGAERLMVSACLETATSFILETKFGWLTSKASFYVAIVYLVGGTAIVLPVSVLQRARSDCFDAMQLMKICTVIAVVAAGVLMYYLSTSEVAILVADCGLISVCMLASSVAEGLSMAAAVPDSWFFSVETAFFTRCIASPLSRFAAPLIVRLTITQSVTFYGVVQLLMTTCGLGLCYVLAWYVKEMKCDEED